MKAERLIPGKILNPAYNGKNHRRALNLGVEYSVPREIEVEAGYVHQSPDCWVLCCPGYMNAEPVCRPADKDCEKRVHQWMTKHRPAQIQNIQNLIDNADKIKDPAERQHVGELAKAYGLKKAGGSKKGEQPAK